MTTAAATTTSTAATKVQEVTSLITQAVSDFRDPLTGVSEQNRERYLQKSRFLRAVQAETDARLDQARVQSLELKRFSGDRKPGALPQSPLSGQAFKLGHQVALRA